MQTKRSNFNARRTKYLVIVLGVVDIEVWLG